jgi:hypothetical protein
VFHPWLIFPLARGGLATSRLAFALPRWHHHFVPAPPLTRDARYFLFGTLALCLAAGLSGALALAVAPPHPQIHLDPFATIFWISLTWSILTGAIVLARTRHPQIWARVVAAEISLNQRFRLPTARTREISSSKFLLTTFVVCFIAFLLLTALAAIFYFKYR